MPIERVIEPQPRDLGTITVQRVLPHAARRAVGPFVFLDAIGPAELAPGVGIDVRPHPHIALATVTYLFDGELTHRDSLGCVQSIRPGDVNWMTAGRGIVHSERTAPDVRKAGHRIQGMQAWVGLPRALEETEPRFSHHPKDSLPRIEAPGVTGTLIAGAAFGARAPVDVLSPIFYAALDLEEGARIALPEEHAERAVYIVSGRVEVDGDIFGPGGLLVFDEGGAPIVKARDPARLMTLGGAPLDGPARHMWWNFVASDPQRIARAKADWSASAAAGFKDTVFSLPPGEEEHIPAPDR